MANMGTINFGNGSKFQWNKTFNGLTDGLGINKQFEIATAEAAARYMNPYVPFKEGFLSQNIETGVDAESGFVKYVSIYANPQYYRVDFVHSKEQHLLASHHWDKFMMQSNGAQFVKEVEVLRKRFVV